MSLTATQRSRATRMLSAKHPRSSAEIAERIGVSPGSIAALKANLTRKASTSSPAPQRRSVRRSGSVTVNVPVSSDVISALSAGGTVRFVLSPEN